MGVISCSDLLRQLSWCWKHLERFADGQTRQAERCQVLGKSFAFVGGGICAIQTLKTAHDALLSAFHSLAESSVYLFISIVGVAVLGIFLVGLSSCLGW